MKSIPIYGCTLSLNWGRESVGRDVFKRSDSKYRVVTTCMGYVPEVHLCVVIVSGLAVAAERAGGSGKWRVAMVSVCVHLWKYLRFCNG